MLSRLLTYLDDVLLPQMQRDGATVPQVLQPPAPTTPSSSHTTPFDNVLDTFNQFFSDFEALSYPFQRWFVGHFLRWMHPLTHTFIYTHMQILRSSPYPPAGR